LLGLCEHGMPFAHDPPAIETLDLRPGASLVPSYRCQPAPEERVADWRRLAWRFCRIMNIHQRVTSGELVAEHEWREIGVCRRPPLTPLAQHPALGILINRQLRTSGIHPVVTCSPSPMLTFGSYERMTLFAALTMQLAMVIVDCRDAICSSCHERYQPERRPHAGQPNYCRKEECQRAANRFRAWRHRQSK